MTKNSKSNMSAMKAVRISNYGDINALAYENAPIPTPGEGEVLIRVSSTSVNPFDCAVRAGYMSNYFHYALPLIPGTDVSGVIEETGLNVTSFEPGDEVYARAGVTRDGSYAEYVVVPVSDVAFKPKSLNYNYSAALPHVTLTAWQALFELANLTAGQSILIHGAAGGVGHIAVQLAKMRGAKVFGTASENIDLLQELNIDLEIDYTTVRFEDVVDRVDVVLDTVGGDTQERSWGVLKPGGMLVSTVQVPSQEAAAAHGVRAAMVFSVPPIGKVLTEVAGLADAGKIKPHISSMFSLKDVRKAHAMIEGRHTKGKIILQVAA
jgi:NADPH:quinone reductase-like Zn-dependent oxidoreductase